jgi:predicted phage terminase large subunit-like protein
MIMQRLHPDDPAGYVLKNEKHDWHYIKIPVFTEAGELIWPGRISADELRTEKEVNPFKYYGQYMQEPTTPGGTILKEEWWNYYTDLEEIVRRCDFILVFGDTAMKKKEANDYSVFQVWGFEGSKRAYLLDQLRGKWEFPELIVASNTIWNKWQDHPLGKNAKLMFVEDKASGTQLIQFEKEKIPIEPWVPEDYDSPKDKPSRVQNAAFMVYGDQVWLPDPDIEGNEWVKDFVEECSLFRQDDTHSHDDQVDVFTMATLTWRSMGGGFVLPDNDSKDD